MNNAFSKKSIFCNSLENQEYVRQLVEGKISYLLSNFRIIFKTKKPAGEVSDNIFICNRYNRQLLRNIQHRKPYNLKFISTGYLQCDPFFISISANNEFSNSVNFNLQRFTVTELEKTKYLTENCFGRTMTNNIGEKTSKPINYELKQERIQLMP